MKSSVFYVDPRTILQDFGYQYKKRVHRSRYTRFFMIPLKGIVYSKLYNFLSKRPNIPGLQRGYTLIS